MSKLFRLPPLILSLIFAHTAVATSAPSSADAQWESRILIVCDAKGDLTQNMIEILNWDGMADRDMFIVQIGTAREIISAPATPSVAVLLEAPLRNAKAVSEAFDVR